VPPSVTANAATARNETRRLSIIMYLYFVWRVLGGSILATWTALTRRCFKAASNSS
jgi:hypothetical protein